MEKKCKKCEVVKSLDEFYDCKGCKLGKRPDCKSCCNNNTKESRKKYREKNREKIKNSAKEYRKNNKEKTKQYYNKNKEKLKAYHKEWHENNREHIKEYKEKNKQKRNKENFIRMRKDALFRIKHNTPSLIRDSLRKQGYSKNTKTYSILKCEFSFFLSWLNGKASNGYKYGMKDLHIDHVIPSSLAKTEEEVLLLNHYSNLQLLTAYDNLYKNNRFVNPLNLARVLEHHPNPDKIREIHARL